MKYKFLLLGLSYLTFTACAQIDESKIKQHIRVLSADSMQGRGTGSLGESMAAAYIEKQFKKIKLEPKGEANSYLQEFPFKGEHNLTKEIKNGG